MESVIESMIKSNKVLICVGTGGVGKTTTSASLALLSAQMGYNTLVLTIDPARRLSTSLGINLSTEPVEIKHASLKAKLFAQIMDDEEIFKNFIKEKSQDENLYNNVVNNILFKQLSTTLSGSQEFTSILKLYLESQNNFYDKIILDTPPSSHTIEFLEAPQKIENLFTGKITSWFVAGQEEMGLFKKIVNRGTGIVLGILKKLTGSLFMEELSQFFNSLKKIEKDIREYCEKADELLKDKDTAFVLISSFDRAKIKEAIDFYETLKKDNFNIKTLIINRAYPKWVKTISEECLSAESKSIVSSIGPIHNFYSERSKIYEILIEKLELKVVKVPEMRHDICGVDDLVMLSKELVSDS